MSITKNLHDFKPESLMMSHGYKPSLSEGSIKCPIFQTSTFVFDKAEDGKAFFEVAYGLREPAEDESQGLIYSRLNNPDLEILEDRLTLWDQAEACAVFESGMSAISTVLMEFLQPGDLLLYSNPLYGGSTHFIQNFLPKYGIHVVGFRPGQTREEIEQILDETGHRDKLAMIYVETPANPTNDLIDIACCHGIAADHTSEDRKVVLAVDNTYLGPLWQHPLKLGADIVMYSATKYIGGHSDVIAGAVLGSAELITRVKTLRTFLGNMTGPMTGWLLMRSLETLKVRMERQAKNAAQVAQFLSTHPKVEKIYYLGMLTNPHQRAIFERQCESAGAMVSFDIKGGEAEAFRFLNGLKLAKLAVSLGSTESLAQHPATMTHAGMAPEEKEILRISPSLVRLSVGVEHIDDLIWDISQALEQA
ncbi:cystathionine gamma-synthase family protein [Pontibacter sp. G13]|uniref:cystathionine gamma-synthase family protein n=1 Tax=Pontibacter sp. G13 TaxID=3074898 RepID=UPI00288C52E7|nr:cystathionine gamma-synthase family protein [Pontibacter sp. G13]WNJ20996.1 cystathionine gamma-synthase family protein [Pontibacter sp. G13]